MTGPRGWFRKYIGPRGHMVSDTIQSGVLILAPFFLPLTDVGGWLSLLGGVWLLTYNHLGQRQNTLYPLISEKLHHLFDVSGIVALLVLPWLVLWDADDRTFFVVMGLVALGLYLITDFTQDIEPPPQWPARLWGFGVRTGLSFIGVGTVMVLHVELF